MLKRIEKLRQRRPSELFGNQTIFKSSVVKSSLSFYESDVANHQDDQNEEEQDFEIRAVDE